VDSAGTPKRRRKYDLRDASSTALNVGYTPHRISEMYARPIMLQQPAPMTISGSRDSRIEPTMRNSVLWPRWANHARTKSTAFVGHVYPYFQHVHAPKKWRKAGGRVARRATATLLLVRFWKHPFHLSRSMRTEPHAANARCQMASAADLSQHVAPTGPSPSDIILLTRNGPNFADTEIELIEMRAKISARFGGGAAVDIAPRRRHSHRLRTSLSARQPLRLSVHDPSTTTTSSTARRTLPAPYKPGRGERPTRGAVNAVGFIANKLRRHDVTSRE